ncbi:hypothetical protein DBR17_14470 [Sphingomonas sp. HMWF008]|nr:hypothetical protein DBR17_14470 [Sphingomonas sp. HMWF008]
MAQVLEVPNSVMVSSAAMFAETLVQTLDRHDSVTLNLDALNEVDLSFLQIVCAARDHAHRTDKVIRLARPATDVVKALLWRAGMLDAPAQDDLDFWFDGAAPQ